MDSTKIMNISAVKNHRPYERYPTGVLPLETGMIVIKMDSVRAGIVMRVSVGQSCGRDGDDSTSGKGVMRTVQK